MQTTDQTGNATRRGIIRPVSIAPMMAYSDRHFRYYMRQISRHTLIYSEMLTTSALIHGDREHLLGFTPEEGPLALQLGGCDAEALAECARIGADFGYDEINLNVGCPSDRVQRGAFGASLMAEPETVARAVRAMRAAVDIPVTVKHRIGIDEIDRYEDMHRFVDIVSQEGSDRFTVHARKAWLKGLSPKENRNIPPLRYEDVYRLKRDMPDEMIEINGGIKSLDAVAAHLEHVDAVMIGRAAVDTPYLFAEVDQRFFDSSEPVLTRADIVYRMVDYLDDWLRKGEKMHRITRHMLTLFAGQPGTRAWKQWLSQPRDELGPEVLLEGLRRVQEVAAGMSLRHESSAHL